MQYQYTAEQQEFRDSLRRFDAGRAQCFLDKDKRGDVKVIEDLLYIGAMNHPGGGKNDIPNRLKRHFFIFNMIN